MITHGLLCFCNNHSSEYNYMLHAESSESVQEISDCGGGLAPLPVKYQCYISASSMNQ